MDAVAYFNVVRVTPPPHSALLGLHFVGLLQKTSWQSNLKKAAEKLAHTFSS
jgi:hypothetical protein